MRKFGLGVALALTIIALTCVSPRDAIADSQPDEQVVVQLWDAQSDAPVRVAFGHLAAIYVMERNDPDFTAWLTLLRQSLDQKTPVRFSYVVAGQRITLVEPAQ
jgi:hypothetical protein